MKIHSDLIGPKDVYDAGQHAAAVGEAGRVNVDFGPRCGSRKRSHAFEVKLYGDGSVSRRRPNSGTRGAGFEGDYACTWSQWGHFLAWLFEVDPKAICGPYDGRADFIAQTEREKPHRGLGSTTPFDMIAMEARWAEVVAGAAAKR